MTNTVHKGHGGTADCVWCGEYVTDGCEVSGYTGMGYDWMDDGDFGCSGSPLNNEEGTGGHVSITELRGEYLLLEQVRELVAGPLLDRAAWHEPTREGNGR